MATRVKIENSFFYEKALRSVRRLREVNGELKNEIVLELLYEHFVNEASKEDVIEAYTPIGGDKSYVARILATHTGKDSCRRPDIRRIFSLFMEEIGQPNPFQNYNTPTERLRKQRPPKPPSFWNW